VYRASPYRGAPHTVVVPITYSLKMLLAYMFYGDKLHSADFVKLSFFNVSDNAGINICEFQHFLSKPAAGR
jgi:hypothetical protein